MVDAFLSQHDVRIPTDDPQVTLSADIYRPADGPPVPALITLLPYRKDLTGPTNQGPWFAARGYAALQVDLRGTGSSDGLRRPEFHPDDGVDARAVIEWATAQPWCDGSVGMWGVSYGAITTMRAASMQLPQLKAIIPLMHGLDPEMDTIHPDGLRGSLHSLINRGSSMLAKQILPPLTNRHSKDEQRRWRERLYETEPVFLDFSRLPPGDPQWRERAITGESITIPSFCVGGWRDAILQPLISAYERITGPKKLLVGPWGHVLPNNSRHEPIDFLSLALDWWDQWLKGKTTDIMTDAVTLYVRGADSPWRSWPTWPPPGDSLRFTTEGQSPSLAAAGHPSVHASDQPVDYAQDPTVGALKGLQGLGLGEYTEPQDQHDDDLRSFSVTTTDGVSAVLIAGRPTVTVRFSTADPKSPPTRLAARLTHVDESGRSTLVTTGTTAVTDSATEVTFALRPTAYLVPDGARIRLSLSEADFPRLNPLPHSGGRPIDRVELTLPTITPASGHVVSPPAASLSTAQTPGVRWTVAREVISGSRHVSFERTSTASTREGHRVTSSTKLVANASPQQPAGHLMEGVNRIDVEFREGDRASAIAKARAGHATLWVEGVVTFNDSEVYQRTWHVVLADEGDLAVNPSLPPAHDREGGPNGLGLSIFAG